MRMFLSLPDERGGQINSYDLGVRKQLGVNHGGETASCANVQNVFRFAESVLLRDVFS